MAVIVTKLDCAMNEVDVVDVIMSHGENQLQLAWQSLRDDAAMYIDNQNQYSTKLTQMHKVEVFEKGYYGRTLKYVYQISSYMHDAEN